MRGKAFILVATGVVWVMASAYAYAAGESATQSVQADKTSGEKATQNANGAKVENSVDTAKGKDAGASMTQKLSSIAEQLRPAITPDLMPVGVAELAMYGPESKKLELGRTATAELARIFSDHGLKVIEREKLGEVLKEMELGQTGIVNEKQAVEAGKLAGARALAFGSVSDFGAYFLVNVRVVKVETGEIVAAAKGQVARADFVAISSEAVELKSKLGAFYRSLIIGWGQVYNEQEAKAGVFVVLEAAAVGATIGMHFAAAKVEDDYGKCVDSGRTGKCSDMRKKGNNYYLTRDIMAGVSAAVWVIAIIDAVVSAKNYTRGPDGAVKEALAQEKPKFLVSGIAAEGDPLSGGLSFGLQY